ncbi:unnamed protein product [Rhizoctonia solani]|uniref:Uncharacterized protein n=1 Tax=Rhizoctonia solani TaxID=456999 RepID=A0A8H3GKJ3_9AGAM|nr:unnamed protein product [Rhizoctonia solani]
MSVIPPPVGGEPAPNPAMVALELQFADRPPFQITYAPKPCGTPGRKPPRGFSIPSVIQMPREQYLLMLHLVHLVCASTRGINMTKTIDRQHPKGLIQVVMLKVLRLATEFEGFCADGYWPLRAFIYVTLKSSSEKHKRVRKAARLRELGESTNIPNPPNPPPHNDSPGNNLGNSSGGDSGGDSFEGPVGSTEDDAEELVNELSSMHIEPPGALDDDDELVNHLSSMHIDPSGAPGAVGDTLADDSDDVGNRILPDELLAPQSGASALVPAPSTLALQPLSVSDELARLTQLHGVLQSLTHLSESERAKLPSGIQHVMALLGVPSQAITLELSPPTSLDVPVSSALTSAQSTITTSVVAPACAPASGALAPTPTPRALTQAPLPAPKSTITIKPKPKGTSSNLPASMPPPAPSTAQAVTRSSVKATHSSIKLQPPVMVPFDDDDNSLSDAPSATSSNLPVLSDNEDNQAIDSTKRTMRTRNTTSARGGKTPGLGRGADGGQGRGIGRGARGSASTATKSSRGRGKGTAEVNDNKEPVVATGSRRKRKPTQT